MIVCQRTAAVACVGPSSAPARMLRCDAIEPTAGEEEEDEAGDAAAELRRSDDAGGPGCREEGGGVETARVENDSENHRGPATSGTIRRLALHDIPLRHLEDPSSPGGITIVECADDPAFVDVDWKRSPFSSPSMIKSDERRGPAAAAATGKVEKDAPRLKMFEGRRDGTCCASWRDRRLSDFRSFIVSHQP